MWDNHLFHHHLFNAGWTSFHHHPPGVWTLVQTGHLRDWLYSGHFPGGDGRQWGENVGGHQAAAESRHDHQAAGGPGQFSCSTLIITWIIAAGSHSGNNDSVRFHGFPWLFVFCVWIPKSSISFVRKQTRDKGQYCECQDWRRINVETFTFLTKEKWLLIGGLAGRETCFPAFLDRHSEFN